MLDRIKRSLCLVADAVQRAARCRAGSPPSATALESDLRTVSRFSPRPEGSPQEKALLAWIEARLSSRWVPFTPFDFSQSDFQHSFSSCLRVDLPGEPGTP